MDVEGSVETAKRIVDVSVVDERKVYKVLSELYRCGVVVAGLRETKWFGSEIYRVGKSVTLYCIIVNSVCRIDYVIMRNEHWRICLDVCVK